MTRASAAAPDARPAFELHVTTAPEDRKVVDGHGHPGELDLVLHYAVCRRLDPDVFAEVPRPLVLDQLADELRGPPSTTRPSTPCLTPAAPGGTPSRLLVSKVDGGRWAEARLDDPDLALVRAALARQTGSDLAPPIDADAAIAFCRQTQDVIRIVA